LVEIWKLMFEVLQLLRTRDEVAQGRAPEISH
jgi:hypothetical protein